MFECRGCGHKFEVVFFRLNKNSCKKCRETTKDRAKKYSTGGKFLGLDQVSSILNRCNCVLKGDYLGAKSKHYFVCKNCDTSFSITFSRLSPTSCPGCREKRLFNSLKPQLQEKGFTLLDQTLPSKYHHLPLKMACSKGHFVSMRPDCILYRGYGCYQCRWELQLKRASDFISSLGYTFDSSEYKTPHSVLTITCQNGHTFKKSFDKLAYYSSRCPHCLEVKNWTQNLENLGVELIGKIAPNKAKILIDGTEQTLTIRQILKTLNVSIFDLWGYTPLEQPLKTKGVRVDRVPFRVKCFEGHEFTTQLRYLLEGHGCKKCATSNVNDAEKELAECFKRFKPVLRDRNILEGKELDIIIPNLKLAIEYCGVFWHSREKGADKYQHQNKMKSCLNKGYKLLTIFESDFIHNKPFIFQVLELAKQGKEIDSNDLRYVAPKGLISEPRVHYFDRDYKKGTTKEFKFSLYDCGVDTYT